MSLPPADISKSTATYATDPTASSSNTSLPVPYPPALSTTKSRWFNQLWILLKHDFTLLRRYRWTTLSQAIFAPIAFLLLLLILQKANNSIVRSSNYRPEAYPLDGVRPCQGRMRGDPCISILFTPDTPQTRAIMQSFTEKNAQRTGSTFTIDNSTLPLNAALTDVHDIVPVSDPDYLYSFVLGHRNTTMFGLDFSIDAGPPVNYRYQVWYNNTLSGNSSDLFGEQTLALVRGVDEAIFSTAGLSPSTSPATIDIQLKDWPQVPPAVTADGVVNSTGALFFFCTQMIIFMAVLNTVVQEKELKLREAMEVMGLRPEVYWIAWWLGFAFLAFVCALVTSLIGLACNFTSFVNTNFAVLLITFFLFGAAMTSFAFFITTFVRKANAAILVGIFIFIIGMLFVSFIFSSTYVGYLWWDSSTSPGARYVFFFLPFFNFGKIYLDIATLTSGKLDTLSDTYTGGPGFHWADLYRPIDSSYLPIYGDANSYRTPAVPNPVQSWYILLLNILVYFLLTLLRDRSGSREDRAPIPWATIFFPWRWPSALARGRAMDLPAWLKTVKPGSIPGEDPDVQEERGLSMDPANPAIVRVANLRKEYTHTAFPFRRIIDKVAVDSLTLSLPEGQLLALLGQNGAGKSTTMKMLSGQLYATGGDAIFYGRSLRGSMKEIRGMLGVCPQDDILFADLNAEEHVALYAGLKGIPKAQIQALMEDRLTAVKLWNVRKRPTATYSGGMKRRLSVIISTIGDPPVVFLDEPTTGMDPVNRRYVWRFLERFKQGRVVILTTHSMEEADVLGDRIAIMAHGQLRALGNSVRLKNRFGAGYRITLVAETVEGSSTLRRHFESRLPHATLEDEAAGSLIYRIPAEDLPDVPATLAWIEGGADGMIRSWGISQTSLEEVFLRLIREANPNAPSKKHQ